VCYAGDRIGSWLPDSQPQLSYKLPGPRFRSKPDCTSTNRQREYTLLSKTRVIGTSNFKPSSLDGGDTSLKSPGAGCEQLSPAPKVGALEMW